jgi:general secretion pathway protein G
MRQKSLFSISGFTLIELLVVITVIGIMVTGATATYRSSQQKARDSIREQDVMALKFASEQYYTDLSYYARADEVEALLVSQKYLVSIPKDPKAGQSDSQTQFNYTYGVAQDPKTSIKGQYYEISANFENKGNSSSKEGCDDFECSGRPGVVNADSGNDGTRWEVGSGMDNVDSSLNTDGSVLGSNTFGGGEPAESGDALILGD